MRSYLCLAFTLAAACTPANATVAPAPSSPAAVCAKDDSSTVVYLVDGKLATCIAAMSVPASRIASVEVFKGAAAVSLYGQSAPGGVVLIQTKQDR